MTFLLVCPVGLAVAQSAASVTPTATFPMPVSSGMIVTKAPGALLEIDAYLHAVSAAGWQDLEGTGTIRLAKGESHAAVLSLSGFSNSRLDITMDSGTRSLRIENSVGKFLDDKGRRRVIRTEASSGGIVAFPKLWAGASTGPMFSVLDGGTASTAGQLLHKITLEYPLFSGAYKAGDPTDVTDLYFDPATHLLLFSVNAVSLTNVVGRKFLRVTTYGSYRQFGQVLVPTTMQQTFAGHLQWTLELADVNINTNLPASTFSF